MRIAVAFKAVPDAQDVQVAGDRTLDFSKAKLTISEYDKNALELGAQLTDEAVAITVGGKDIDNSKLKKDVMARGMGHLWPTWMQPPRLPPWPTCWPKPATWTLSSAATVPPITTCSRSTCSWQRSSAGPS